MINANINIRIYNREQLINELREYYTNILADTAEDVINCGMRAIPIPSLILENGLNSITDRDLMTAASTWAEMIIDCSFDGDDDKKISMILFRSSRGVDDIIMTATGEIKEEVLENKSEVAIVTQPHS